MKNITISAKKIESILESTSKDEMRYNLAGIFFNGKCSEVVGIDGHMLSVAKFESDESVDEIEHIISNDSIKQALALHKATPRRERNENLTFSFGEKVTCLGIELKVIVADFPDYKQVMPQDPSQFKFKIGVPLLEKMVKQAKKTGLPKGGVEFDFSKMIDGALNNQGAIRYNIADLSGVVMPMRLND